MRRTLDLIAAGLALILWTPASQAQGQEEVSDAVAQLRSAAQFDFGAFCIDRIPAGAITAVSRPSYRGDGIWRDVTLTVSEEAAQRPHIYFLSGAARVGGRLSACGTSLPAGVARILEGDILSGTVKFSMLTQPNAGFSIAQEIAPAGLDVVLSKVRLQFAPLYGGKVEARSLKVTNVGQFISNAMQLTNANDDLLSGQLKVGSRKLEIRGAQVRLPGSSQSVAADFSATEEGSAVLVSVPSGAIELYSGAQRTTKPLVWTTASTVSAAGVTMETSKVEIGAATMRAYARAKSPTLSMQNWKSEASQLTHASAPYAGAVPRAPVLIRELVGLLSDNAGSADLTQATVRNLTIATADLALGGAADSPAVSGSGTITVREITDGAVDASMAIGSPLLGSVNRIAAVSGDSLRVQITGAKSSAKISGDFGLGQIAMGSLGLKQLENARVAFSGAAGATEFGLPFSIDTSASQGAWSFTNPKSGKITLEGQLKSLTARGTLWFGQAERPPRIEVEPGSFRFGAQGSVVRESLLFGAAPEHTELSAGLNIFSIEGFVISKDSVEGSAQVAAGLLVVNEPQLSFDLDDQVAFRIKAPIRFAAGAEISIDLQSLATSLRKGDAEIVSVAAEATNPEQPFTLSGIKVRAPSISLGRLQLHVEADVGRVLLSELALSASSLEQTADPAWSATDAAVTLGRLDALLAQVNDAVQMKDGSLEALQVTAAKGSYTSRDGFHVDGDTVRIGIAAATPMSLTDAEVSIDRGLLKVNSSSEDATTTARAPYRNFRVRASGSRDDVNGDLRLDVTSIDATHKFPAIPKQCSELKLAVVLSAGAFALNGAIEHGAARGRIFLNDPKVSLKKTSDDSCEWRETYRVDVLKPVTSSVCSIPLLGDAVCRTVTKLIKVNVDVPVQWRAKVQALSVGLKADDASVVLSGKRGASVCINDVKVDALGKVQSFTVVPTFSAHGDLAKLVKKIWQTAFEIAEGSLTAGLLTSLANLPALVTELFPQDYCKA